MSNTTTLAEVKSAFRRMLVAAQTNGINVQDVVLIKGSPTYGRAWRIVRVHPVDGGHYSWGGPEYLGSSKGEALQALRIMADTFHMVSGTNVPRDHGGNPWPMLAQDDPARRVRTDI